MNTKEAINYVESKRYVFEHFDNNKLADEVIDLLKRGEKFEQMWGEIKENTSQYDRGKDTLDKIYELEQKYSPKPKEV